MGLIVSNWTVFAASGLAAVAAFVSVLAGGRLGNPYTLPICFFAGIAAAALDYMQNGQIVGQGFGAIADLFIRVAIVAAIYTGVGLVAGGLLATGILKLRGQSR
jgi:hypothetical protein